MPHPSLFADLSLLLASGTDVARLERVLDATESISESIHSTLDPEVILQHALTGAADAMGCDTAAISLHHNERWVISHVLGFPESAIGSVMDASEERHAVLAKATREPVPIDDAFVDPRVNQDHMQKWGVRSVLVVPLIVGDDVMGVMFLNYQARTHRFDPLDLFLGKKLALSLALALNNARLHRTLQDELKERERANRLKDDFLAVLSHELRTPLNAVVGYASLLRSGVVRDDRARHAIDAIYRNAQAQQRLVESLLDISRFIAGKLDFERHPVALGAVVDAAVDVVRPDADEKAIALAVEVPERDVIVVGDAQRLQQVCWNLLANAVKFTPRGGRITVRVEAREASARIEVRDTGQGISPDFLPYIFDRFRQAGGGERSPRAGLGLGLAVVREIVDAHGGTVSADSVGEGGGSAFVVSLPLAPTAADAASSSPVR